jgi:hypothetical protein
LTPGDGFKRCFPLDILADVKDTTGQILTGATGPLVAALETNFIGLQAAASTTFMGRFNWTVPDDYDDAADYLRIRIACDMAGTTNQALSKITPTIYRKRPVPSVIPDGSSALPAGLALSADLGAPATAVGAIPLVGSHLATAWVEINADYWSSEIAPELRGTGSANRSLAATADASIQAGDLLSITLTAASHTTDAINIYGLEMWYRSNLAFTNIGTR